MRIERTPTYVRLFVGRLMLQWTHGNRRAYEPNDALQCGASSTGDARWGLICTRRVHHRGKHIGHADDGYRIREVGRW